MNMVKDYLEWKASYTTRAAINYKPWLEKFHNVTQKNVLTAELSDIMVFRKWLDIHHQPASVMLAMIVVSNYFRFYRLQGRKCLDPQLIRIPKVKANSYQHATPEDYVKLLAQIRPDSFVELQNLVILRLLWDTGMRVSEVTSLDISQIDPDRMYATITTAKNHQMRQVFWSIETHLFIKEFLKQRKELNHTPALFVGIKQGIVSRRLTPRSVQRLIQRLSKNAKIEKRLNPHSFRHGKAHKILDQGGNPKDVQAILGHTDPTSSFTYLQWNDQEFERRAKMFL